MYIQDGFGHILFLSPEMCDLYISWFMTEKTRIKVIKKVSQYCKILVLKISD